MTRREFAAWLIVAFLVGSAVTPSRGHADYQINSSGLWAIRNAIAHVCEGMAVDHQTLYDARRCWR